MSNAVRDLARVCLQLRAFNVNPLVAEIITAAMAAVAGFLMIFYRIYDSFGQILKITIFALYGIWEGLGACEILSLVVAVICPQLSELSNMLPDREVKTVGPGI